jgi:hypothetical protein
MNNHQFNPLLLRAATKVKIAVYITPHPSTSQQSAAAPAHRNMLPIKCT